MDYMVLLAMGAYMALVLGIGIYYSTKNKTSDDYFIGGRRLGPWVTAMSAEASDMSSWLLMGLPGVAYLKGFGEAGWTAIGLIIGTYLNWKIVATRLRKYSQVANNSITIPDFFSNRFRDERHILMTISSVMIIVFFTVYTASGFSACGKLFNSVFGSNYHTAMIVCGLVIVAYTFIGGFLAASTTDFAQGMLMSISIVIVLIVGTLKAGGIQAVIDHAKSLPGYLEAFSTYDITTNDKSAYGFMSIFSGLAWGLGYFGVPHILIRFMAIHNSKEIKKSRHIAMVWVVISLSVATCIGFIGSALSAKGVIPSLVTKDQSETIFIVITNTFLLPIFAGVVLSGILAATMSTSDSQLLMVSSSVGSNIYKQLLKKDATDKQILFISKATILVVALFSILIAWDPNSSVFELVSYAWAGFGAAFGPLILFSLFWKRTTKLAAICGMVGGGTLSVIWSLWISKLGGIFSIYALLPAFLFASILIVVISLLDKEPDAEIQNEFDQVQKADC